MRPRFRFTVSLCLFVAAAVAADEKAFLRLLPPEEPKEMVVEVVAEKPANLAKLRVTLLAKGNPALSITPEDSDVAAFRFRIPPGTKFTAGEMPSLLVEDEAASSFYLISVDSELRISMTEANCVELPGAQAAVLTIVVGGLRDSREYGAKRIAAMRKNLQSLTATVNGALDIQPEGQKETIRREVRRSTFPATSGGFGWCLQTDSWEKDAKSYKLAFTPPSSAPFELVRKLETSLSIAQIKAEKATASSAGPGTRTFERNLDLAAIFSSSVKNSVRTTQGALDIRIAPMLNWQATPVKLVRRPIWWWTPGFLDAKVATGKLTKDTISTNTIVVGSEAEMRYYFNAKPSADLLRTTFRVAHASDRDFKQSEIKGMVEVQPLAGVFWRPMRTKVDTTGKSPVDRVVSRSFGFEFRPAIGMELGRRYTEPFSQAPFPGSAAVRRLTVAGELTVDLTIWLKLTVKDKMYLRGEAWQVDRWHNWFSGEAAVPFGGSSAHHFFFSFERGGQPPFSTPDANAVKAGYRVLMDGWLGRTR